MKKFYFFLSVLFLLAVFTASEAGVQSTSTGTLLYDLKTGPTKLIPAANNNTPFIPADRAELIIGSGTSTQTYPLDRYYNYSTCEMIYTQAELGSAKVFTTIGFYKSSGSDVNPITPVTIYMKNTTNTILTTGEYDLTGYTEVYNGSFTNASISGWDEVTLSSTFSYDGVSNLQILVKKGYQDWINEYPLYTYTTASSNRVRQNRSDDEQPGIPGGLIDLVAGTSLPNVKFNYTSTITMTYVSSTTTQNTNPVIINSTNNDIIGLQIVTTGGASPLSATSFTFNTNGTTNVADIANAKLWKTPGGTFTSPTQLGSTIPSPSGSMVFDISGSPSVLVDGTNYFWISYDIPGTATLSNVVDAECNSFVLTDGSHSPSPQAPAGNRTIISCIPAGTYTIGIPSFNKASGKNLYTKIVKQKIEELMPIFESNISSDKNTNIDKKSEYTTDVNSESIKIIGYEKRIIEKDVTVIMENGKPYAGSLVHYSNDRNAPPTSYATITAALADLNIRGVCGAVIFTLMDATYPSETFPLVINSIPGVSSTNTFTLRPAPGVTSVISGSVDNGAILKVFNTNYVTIDGSNTVGGTTRDLTLTNTSVTYPNVFWIGSNSTTPISDVTLKNCILNNGSTNSSNTVVSDGTALGSAGYFNNITIQNNDLRKMYIGMYINGGTGTGTNVNVINNKVDNSDPDSWGRIGIYLQGIVGAIVSGNAVGGSTNSLNSWDSRGFWFASGCKNVTVEKNKIYDIHYTGTSGYAGQGIIISTANSPANIQVKNNVMYNLTGDGWDYSGSYLGDNPLGVFAFTTQTEIQIYNNSINLYGNTLNQTNALSMCIALGTGTTADIRNNCLVNNLGLLGTTGYGSTVIYAQTSNTQFTDINYNNYFVNPSGSGTNSIGIIVTTSSATLNNWKTATGKDKQSLSGDPGYTSATNLLPDGTNQNSWNENGNGTQISLVPDDINGNPRSTTVPNGPTDFGAYEFTPTVASPTMIQTGTIGVGNTTSYSQSLKTYLDITWGASADNTGGINRETVNNVRENNNLRSSTSGIKDYPGTVTVKKYSGVDPPDVTGIPSPQMSKGYWYVDTDADPGSPVTVKVYWGYEELGNISDTSKLILAMYDMKNRAWVPFSRGTGDGYSVVDHANKTITVSGLTRLDSVCYALTSSDAPLKRFVLDLTLLIEGLYYDGGNPPNMVADTITAELRQPGTYTLIETMTIPLDQYGKGYGYTASTLAVTDNLFWIAIKHRNALETWCDTTAVKPMFSRLTGTAVYDFTSAQSQAFGSNMVLKNSKWCMYSGDIYKDGFIDGTDMALLDIDLYNYAGGWIPTDLTGDQFVDGSDMAIVDINLYNYIGSIKPDGAPGYMKMLNRPKRENAKIKTDINVQRNSNNVNNKQK